MPRDVISRTADPTIAAFRVAGREWPRGLLAPVLVPDAWLALVDTRDGRRRLVVAGDDPRPAADDSVTLVRSRPLATPVEVGFRPDADGVGIAAVIELLLRVVPREHELAAFARLVPDGGALSLARVAELTAHSGAVHAITDVIGSSRAAELLSSDVRSKLHGRMSDALCAFLFDAGLELVGVTRAQFRASSDPLFAAQARTTRPISIPAAAREAAQPPSFDNRSHSSGFGTDRAATLGERDGGSFRLPGSISGVLVLDSRRITRFDASGRTLRDSGIEPPPDLGPLRSISVIEGDSAHAPAMLAVGARRGVWLLNAADGRALARCEAASANAPATGFNRCVRFADHLVATHSQLGVWAWPFQSAGSGGRCVLPAEGRPVRAPTPVSSQRLLIACGRVLRELSADYRESAQFDPAPADLHDVAVVDGGVYVATDDGRVLYDRLDRQQGVWEQLFLSSSALESIDVQRRDGRLEVVIPDRRHGIVGLYPESRESRVLLRGSTPIRRVIAQGDALIAISELRERVLLGNLATGGDLVELRGAEYSAGSVQDVALVAGHV
ncbi:MAG: hypothetical protein HRU75_07785 [Planctomycetia bacterium]|nr:MAG: hypothetical protein HRU75_07785 [Planctomycetia bacterium]